MNESDAKAAAPYAASVSSGKRKADSEVNVPAASASKQRGGRGAVRSATAPLALESAVRTLQGAFNALDSGDVDAHDLRRLCENY